MFSGVYWNQPVYPSVGVRVQNTSYCQIAGGGILSHRKLYHGGKLYKPITFIHRPV